MNLFKGSNKRGSEKEQDHAVQKLMKERNSIAASMKSINDVIRLFRISFTQYVLISIILPPLFFAIFLLLLVKHLKRVIP